MTKRRFTIRGYWGLLALAPLALALGACASLPEDYIAAERAAAPVFDPFQFFAGPSQSTGTSWRRFRDDIPVRTISSGRIERLAGRGANWAVPVSGVLVIEQMIEEGNAPPRARTLELRMVGEGRFEGRSSDSLGPVEGFTKGNLMTLQYTRAGNYQVTETWTLGRDGRSAEAITRVMLMGVPISVRTEAFVKG